MLIFCFFSINREKHSSRETHIKEETDVSTALSAA